MLAALLGDLMVQVTISTRAGDSMGTLMEKRRLRKAFEEGGLPLPDVFAIALTTRRILIYKLGVSGRPKRFVGAVDLAKVANVEVEQISLKRRMGTITLANGERLPVRVYPKADPEGFARSFADVAGVSSGPGPAA